MHVVLTSLQLLVGQAGVFTTKYQSHFAASSSLLATGHAALARIEQRPGNAPIASTGANHQTATNQRLFKTADDLRRIQHIGCAGRARHGIATGEILRFDQHQARQTHVFHRPRRAADVARMTGAHQNHANIVQQRRHSQKSLGGNDLTQALA